jgi:hypothetical protein
LKYTAFLRIREEKISGRNPLSFYTGSLSTRELLAEVFNCYPQWLLTLRTQDLKNRVDFKAGLYPPLTFCS